MSLKSRLAKLEKILGRPAACPQCHDSPVQQICIYEEEPDGSLRLVEGTPPAPCPACGRMPSADGISKIVIARQKERSDRPEDPPPEFFVLVTDAPTDSGGGSSIERR